jgi:hypothetical protein
MDEQTENPEPDGLDESGETDATPDAGPGSSFRRAGMFIGGFGLALFLMLLCGSVGVSAGGVIGALVGGIGAPISLIVFARSHGIRPLAAGAITAVAVVVIVFGGCLMVLSNGHW